LELIGKSLKAEPNLRLGIFQTLLAAAEMGIDTKYLMK